MSIVRFTRITLLTLIVLGGVTLLFAARIIAREDPLQHADAIYVLGGSWIDRWLEAVDLYHDGYAPHIVVSDGTHGVAERELIKRGVQFPGPGELSRRAMVDQMHIPADAVEVLGEDLDNTAQEADVMATMAAARHWKRIIVITGKASTRRAAFAMQRALGPGVEIIMRGPRLDTFPGNGWWTKRTDFRTVFFELPKLVAYWCGLKG